MDLRQLRYFCRIVELESITAAAEALHIAQPSLSQHVANLEAEFSTRLLVRSPMGVTTTDIGRVLYRHAKMVLRQVEEARVAVERGRDTPAGHVTLGLPTSTSRVLADLLIEAVSARMPEVTLELIEGSSADLGEAVARQRMDVAIAMDVQQQPRMQVTPLLDEELMLVGARQPGNVEAVSLQEVARLPLLLPSFPNSIRVLIERAFAEAGLQYTLVAETSAVSILLAAARAKRGWTILPTSALAGSEAPGPSVAAIPISDPSFHRRASLCLSAQAQTSLGCMAIHDLVIEIARELVASKRWQGVTWLGA